MPVVCHCARHASLLPWRDKQRPMTVADRRPFRPLPVFPPQTARAILGALILFALVLAIRGAWMSDDALITVRCVLNALHGYGPNFNIDERVQAFTDPLWFLCTMLLTAPTGNPWVALIALSLGCLILTLWLVFARLGGSGWAGLAACLILLLSKAFLDFSASGLETPLSTVLELAVIAAGTRRLAGGRGLTRCLTGFSLLYLCRPDLVLLLAPFALVVVVKTCRGRRELAISLAVAAAPVLAWSGFSLLYYGALVPNTALAKLGGGVPLSERLLQGVVYLLDSLGRDSVTLPAIAAGILLGFRRGAAGAALSIGMVLYLAYIVRIGGDHMSGRFLVAPLVVACALVAQIRLPGAATAAAGLCLAVLGAINLPATWLFETDLRQQDVPRTGIADERAYFFAHLGLIHVSRTMLAAPSWPKHLRAPSQFDIMACGGLGLYGMMHGPATHVADQCALVDPLLSRLPAAPDPHWRIGHLIRAVPAGYKESLVANANLVKDPAVAKLYDRVRLLTRGDVFSWRRDEALLF